MPKYSATTLLLFNAKNFPRKNQKKLPMRLAFWRKRKEPKKKKKVWREWLDAALFALIAATIIRTFFFEAYTIPTESMEGTLLVNDYMFVSKMAYGARMPMTPIAVPLVHNSIFGGKSYTDAVQWKYRRLPGFRDIERNDIVVFNFPNNDTTIDDPMYRAHDYYGVVRENGRAAVWNNFKVITHPVDKRENYIKRCVGIPGDVIEIRDGELFVNNQPAVVFPHQRTDYLVKSDKAINFSEDFIKENNEIHVVMRSDSGIVVNMEHQAAENVKKISGVTEVRMINLMPKGQVGKGASLVYPYDPINFPWNQDNYGPLTIPAKGTTISLTPENIALYDRVIRIYEGNTLTFDGTNFSINGQQTDKYTFKMDYYWMMGDNRHHSADSRFWGFVPEDHVVGTPSFIWLSYSKNGITDGIRWNRLFRGPKTLEK